MIKINKITIIQRVEIKDEQARLNLKELLASVLKVDQVNVLMRFDDESESPKPFREGL